MKNNTSFLFIFVVISILAASILLYRDYRTTHLNPTEDLLYPNLENQLNDITQILINSKGGKEIHLDYQDGIWQVREEKRQPANINMIRSLMVNLSLATLKSPKTDDPKRYESLGLDENQAVQLIVKKDENSKPLIDLYIGHTMPSLGGTYVRMNDQDQTWFVSGNLEVAKQSKAWLQPKE